METLPLRTNVYLSKILQEISVSGLREVKPFLILKSLGAIQRRVRRHSNPSNVMTPILTLE